MIPGSRRIVRRAVISLVGVVLLLGWYVGSVSIVCAAHGADLLPTRAMPAAMIYIRPWYWYIEDSQWPGDEWCKRATLWFWESGRLARKRL